MGHADVVFADVPVIGADVLGETLVPLAELIGCRGHPGDEDVHVIGAAAEHAAGCIGPNLAHVTAAPPVTRRPPPLVLLALVTAIAPVALHMLVPVLPVLVVVFAAPPGVVQLVLTLFLAGIAAGQLVYGPMSDRFGRRPVLIAGLALFLAGTALCVFAWSLPVLILGRTFEALGGCAGMVLGRAVVRDIYDRERSASAFARIMMVMSLAPSLAPAIGAYLAEWGGWRADFALLGMIGVAVLILTVSRLEETHAPAPVNFVGMIGSFLLLLRTPAFLSFAFATAFTSASWFTFLAAAPYLLS